MYLGHHMPPLPDLLQNEIPRIEAPLHGPIGIGLAILHRGELAADAIHGLDFPVFLQVQARQVGHDLQVGRAGGVELRGLDWELC